METFDITACETPVEPINFRSKIEINDSDAMASCISPVSSHGLWSANLISGVCIVLTGFPERVLRVADAVDEALPGQVAWRDLATAVDGGAITLEGIGQLTLEDRLTALSTRQDQDEAENLAGNLGCF